MPSQIAVSRGFLASRALCLPTPRLALSPLSRGETELYLTDVRAFARALGLSAAPLDPDPETRAAANWCVEYGLRLDAVASVWGAFWGVFDRTARTLVGNLGFKGVPEGGVAEVGYAIDAPYRGRGYMTESLRALAAWGRERSDLRSIVAETYADNLASQKALANAGFLPVVNPREKDGPIFWRLDVF